MDRNFLPLNFVEAVGRTLLLWRTFDGRSRRSELFWSMFALPPLLVTGLRIADAAFPAPVLIGGFDWESGSSQVQLGPLTPASLVVYLAVGIPALSLGVRRLHDLGRSGKWILLPVLWLILQYAALAVGWESAVVPIAMTGLPFVVVMGFYLMLTPSRHGPNRYGPDPMTVNFVGLRREQSPPPWRR